MKSVFIRPLTETQELIQKHRTQSAEAVNSSAAEWPGEAPLPAGHKWRKHGKMFSPMFISSGRWHSSEKVIKYMTKLHFTPAISLGSHFGNTCRHRLPSHAVLGHRMTNISKTVWQTTLCQNNYTINQKKSFLNSDTTGSHISLFMFEYMNDIGTVCFFCLFCTQIYLLYLGQRTST